MLNRQWNVWLSRVLPYWLTVLAVSWTLAYFYFYNAPIAYARFETTTSKVRLHFRFIVITKKVFLRQILLTSCYSTFIFLDICFGKR